MILAAWGIVYAAVAARYPWHTGFDDFDHIPAALRWSREHELSADGLFLRVPLWPIVLGTSFSIFGQQLGLFIVQFLVVASALVLYFRALEPRPEIPAALVYLPPLCFATSPQVVLYARHAVNEPFVGLLVMLVIAAGSARSVRPVVLGMLCAAATMVKISNVWLVLPCVGWLLVREDSTVSRFRTLAGRLAKFALGLALVVIPLLLLHLRQRGGLLMDTTAAFNLSGLRIARWTALGSHADRFRGGMAHFEATFSADPLGYMQGFVGRLGRWLLRPSSADFARFYKSYPHGLIRVYDHVVLYGLAVLAAILGARGNALVWVFLASVVVNCTFPQHTPYSPKVILVYPLLLLVALGLRRRFSDRAPRTYPST
jgi:hypothetical protein